MCMLIYKYILFFLIVMIVSCNGNFESYDDGNNNPPDVTSPEDYRRNVNILPTLSDPQYSIQPPRGSGIFDDFDKDKEHWLDTRFNVFGLLTGNGVGGKADYVAAQGGDRHYAVLWNQRMGISDPQGHTVFYDSSDQPVVCKYSSSDKLYRYKFFLLGTDGLDADLRVENNTIVARMNLDGTNDVMHSFAYHTDEQYSQGVAQLPNDETTKMFLEGGKDNLYNRLSGNRGFHPIFNVKHLMSRFEVRVKGANPPADRSCDFLRVFIKDVQIKAAKRIDVVVADDRWERDTYLEQFKESKLLSQVGEASMYSLPILPNILQNTQFTMENRADMDFDYLNEESRYLSEQIGEEIIPDGTHWLGSMESEQLCENILLPPLPTDDTHFELSFKYRYVYMHYDPISGKYHIGQGADVEDRSTLWEDFDVTMVIPDVDSDGKKVHYEGGRKYVIGITVYGKSVALIDVVQPTLWNDGGSIDVGGD